MLKKYSLIFWDFDGVIKESNDIKTEAFVELFSSYGKDISSEIKNHHLQNNGMSRFEKIPIYLKWSGIQNSKENIEVFSKKFGNIVVKKVINAPWVKGVKSYLDLNINLQKFVLVSATPKNELDFILKELMIKTYFSKVYGSPMHKNNAIKECLEIEKISKNECLMIGDSISDQKAAIENGVDFLLRKHDTNKDIFQDYRGKFIRDFSSL